ALAVPGRDVLERVVGRELDPGPLQKRVDVRDVDELRPALVRARGDRAGDRLVTELGTDADDLPGLHVRADDDGEFRKPREVRLGHRASLRITAAAWPPGTSRSWRRAGRARLTPPAPPPPPPSPRD